VNLGSVDSATETTAVVASIEETAERYSIPEAFIGLILLPIVVCILPREFNIS
jgi:Ca2+/H+ antiporter